MKIAAFVVAFSAAVAAFQKVPELEVRAWQTCLNDALDKFDQGNDGSDVGCDTYQCFQSTGEKYSRGGALNKAGLLLVGGCRTVLAPLVSPTCPSEAVKETDKTRHHIIRRQR